MNQAKNKKLYVGSLPYSVTEEELQNLFSSYGEVTSVKIISDKFTGLSKGFGFVEMASEDEAEKAIEGMNGQKVGGRTLVVNAARPEQRNDSPRRERSFSGEGRGGAGEGRRRSFRDRD